MNKRLIIQAADHCLIIDSEVKKEWKPILFYGFGSFFLGAPIYFSLSIVEGEWWLTPIALLIALIGYYCLKKFMWQLIGFEKIVIEEGIFKIITMGWLNERTIKYPIDALQSIQVLPPQEKSPEIDSKEEFKHNYSLFTTTQLQFEFEQKIYQGFAGYDYETSQDLIHKINAFIKQKNQKK